LCFLALSFLNDRYFEAIVMSTPIVISVDVMGGDVGVAATLPAAQLFLQTHVSARLILVGTQDALAGFTHERVTTVIAHDVIAMDDSLETAMRKKRDSSMRVAIEQVKSGAAHAAVSAGNTGALMAISRYVLKTLEGIDRPAIAAQLPNAKGGGTTMLDLGANVDSSAQHLLQFAYLASALDSVLKNKPKPTIGLLNIGEEVIKGNETIKAAGELLRAAHARGDLHFYGNVEGNDIFKGTTDIVVCDGFVGNVALKASEGLATMVGGFLRTEFGRNPLTKLAALLAYPILRAFKNRVDHRRYNGAALLGLRGLVFKSHGSADAVAYGFALNRAYEAAQKDLLGQVQANIAKIQVDGLAAA
jgi:phosphate acyltransferase